MATLDVPGTALHHQVRGSGPLLLIAQSGEGDADRGKDLVDALADDHTVVTYDRRGLSRSRFDGPVTIADHADDVHRLLAALTDEPALVLGCSLGAVIGLHLVARHPEQVGTLVAHEPVAPWLLPDADRHRRELLDIQAEYRRGGLAVALREVARVLGIDPVGQDTEPDLTPEPMTPARVANFDFFLTRDFDAVVRDDLRLGPTPVRIVPAAGRTTPRTIFDHRCATALADRLGVAVEEFPGGHNGNTTHPRAYAARLREVLAGAREPVSRAAR
ncbi:MAG: alpha/beta hydrolase [Umezawaea sp.]